MSATRRLIIAFAVLTGVLAGCGSSEEAAPVQPGLQPTPGEETETPDPTPTPSSLPAPRGWLDGEPVWDGGDEAAFAADTEAGDDGGGDAMTEDVARLESDADIPAPPIEGPGGDLTGGSIDDNERFEDYLAYRDRVKALEIPVRDVDPTGRVVISVVGEDGGPVPGATVSVTGGDTQLTFTTTADGTVRFHPRAYGLDEGPFRIVAGDTEVEAVMGESLTLTTGLATVGADDTISLELLFLLDATGSMSDEIDQLKRTIADVAARIDELPANVETRFAMTLYRDEGDAFVATSFDFTPEVDAFAAALADVQANGGGDYPEALDEALAEALSKPAWGPAGDTVQLVFLVADAPPQVLRDVPVPYSESMLDAAERGIKIFPVSSSGTDDQAEFVFRQLAQFTGARYTFLTYGAGGRATGESTDITEVDYEELSLDDLIVRSVTEELAAMTGTPEIVPTPEPIPTPDGQGGN